MSYKSSRHSAHRATEAAGVSESSSRTVTHWCAYGLRAHRAMKKATGDQRKATAMPAAAAEAVGKSKPSANTSKPSTNTSKPSTNTAKPRKAAAGATATGAGDKVGDLYSPPCTRSQKDRFEKRMEVMEDPMLEASKTARQRSDAGTGRPALKELGNAPRANGAGSAAPKKIPAPRKDQARPDMDSTARGPKKTTAPSKDPKGSKKVQSKGLPKTGTSVK